MTYCQMSHSDCSPKPQGRLELPSVWKKPNSSKFYCKTYYISSSRRVISYGVAMRVREASPNPDTAWCWAALGSLHPEPQFINKGRRDVIRAQTEPDGCEGQSADRKPSRRPGPAGKHSFWLEPLGSLMWSPIRGEQDGAILVRDSSGSLVRQTTTVLSTSPIKAHNYV